MSASAAAVADIFRFSPSLTRNAIPSQQIVMQEVGIMKMLQHPNVIRLCEIIGKQVSRSAPPLPLVFTRLLLCATRRRAIDDDTATDLYIGK